MWKAAWQEFHFSPVEAALLEQGLRELDRAIEAEEVLRTEGLTVATGADMVRAHPCVKIAKDSLSAHRAVLRGLGPERPVSSITPDEVERATATSVDANGWSDRTQGKLQKYLKAATRYGHVKLKRLPEDTLTAVDFGELDTTPTTNGLEYDRHEVALLCAPHESMTGASRSQPTSRRTWAGGSARSADCAART